MRRSASPGTIPRLPVPAGAVGGPGAQSQTPALGQGGTVAEQVEALQSGSRGRPGYNPSPNPPGFTGGRGLGLPRKPEEIRRGVSAFSASSCEVKSDGASLAVTFPGMTLGIFDGNLRFTVYRGTSHTRLRERTGLSVVGLWERGKLAPAFPHTVLQATDVIVIAGSATQMASLAPLVSTVEPPSRPVLVIGAGKVGQAAARALHRKGLAVHAVDRTADALEEMRPFVTELFAGDAADRRHLTRAGINDASSVLLTTNNDAMNIYLAVFCRRLNPRIRIVSRITLERNVEAIHRAGADFVLSYTTLGIEAILSLLRGQELVLLGEGVELFSIPVPPSLAGRQLKDSGIGSRTGMSVVALERGETLVNQLTAETILTAGATLLMLGSLDQRKAFAEAFEKKG